jgi:hypothetical protein
VVLREPTRIAFLDALAAVKTRATRRGHRRASGRRRVLSGHADDHG